MCRAQFLKIHLQYDPPSISFLVSSYDPIMEDFFTSSGSSDEKKTKFNANIYTNIIALDFKKSTNINKNNRHQTTSTNIKHMFNKHWNMTFLHQKLTASHSPTSGVQLAKIRCTTLQVLTPESHYLRYVAVMSRWDSTQNYGNSHCQEKWNRQHWERKTVNHIQHVHVHEVMNKSTIGIPPNEPNCIDVYIVKHTVDKNMHRYIILYYIIYEIDTLSFFL